MSECVCVCIQYFNPHHSAPDNQTVCPHSRLLLAASSSSTAVLGDVWEIGGICALYSEIKPHFLCAALMVVAEQKWHSAGLFPDRAWSPHPSAKCCWAEWKTSVGWVCVFVGKAAYRTWSCREERVAQPYIHTHIQHLLCHGKLLVFSDGVDDKSSSI